MLDIRQSPPYANFMKLLGWRTEKIGNGQVFVRKFPLIGSIIKVQRIKPPIPFLQIEKLAKRRRAFLIEIDQEKSATGNFKKYGYKINKRPYFPTKTIQIDLTRNEEEIFNSFSEAKRRAVRRAIKNGIIVKEANSYKEFLWLKKKSLLEKFVLPIMAEKEIKTLWQAFWPNNGKIILAYFKNQPVAGIFLLHYNKVAYYWLAASTKLGKKLFAPTLLVWETLKIAKKLGCQVFDFEGIYDQRFPVKSWLGFTKFKQGFEGKEIFYPPSLKKFLFPGPT
jgi:lipid II:glycine glycyltransferase (peptidoglycan interpeptide bridge formation enzyme)